jgi:hypothetical protein
MNFHEKTHFVKPIGPVAGHLYPAGTPAFGCVTSWPLRGSSSRRDGSLRLANTFARELNFQEHAPAEGPRISHLHVSVDQGSSVAWLYNGSLAGTNKNAGRGS